MFPLAFFAVKPSRFMTREIMVTEQAQFPVLVSVTAGVIMYSLKTTEAALQ